MDHPPVPYVVCTAPRTGSSLLCQSLMGTGVAGFPHEFFDIHDHNEAFVRRQLSIDRLDRYLHKVLVGGTTPNGVFGVKLHWHQFPSLLHKLSLARGEPALASTVEVAALPALMEQAFGDVRYVWLRRRNPVAQAISYYRASNSGVWRVPRSDETPAPPPPGFDPVELTRFHGLVRQFDRGWGDFFASCRKEPLILHYEDFVPRYEESVRSVLRFIGVDDPAIRVPVQSYRRQADDVSAAWEAMLRAGPPPAPPKGAESFRAGPGA